MANRTAWPTVATGDAWSASQNNTFGRDNDLAYWAFTNAGDMVYASSAQSLARLAIGAAGTIMTSTGSAPQWSPKTAITGLMNSKAEGDFAPSQAFTTIGVWQDVTGATVTLGPPVTSSVLLLAVVTGRNDGYSPGHGFFVRGVVDGVVDPGTEGQSEVNVGAATPRNEALLYEAIWTGVPAGSRVCKLQCTADSNDNIVVSGRIIALAFPE